MNSINSFFLSQQSFENFIQHVNNLNINKPNSHKNENSVKNHPIQCKVHDLDPFILKNFKINVIAGFLNLGKNQGWPEGHDTRIGALFSRHILQRYVNNPSNSSHRLAEILGKVTLSFKNLGMENIVNTYKEAPDGHRPKFSRASYDSAIQGWKQHAICRLVGNLASKYDPSKPFFEILVNAQRISADNPKCKPYFVTIHENESQLDERRKTLASLKEAESKQIGWIFYSKIFDNPEQFLEKHKDKMGPNATRTLKGLTYLNNKEMQAQITGNCWIKQPLRSLLATLFLEIYSANTDSQPEEAWNEAVTEYKRIQKEEGIPLIQELLDVSNVTPQMKAAALQEIEHRKQF